jgi:hypothetical protein
MYYLDDKASQYSKECMKSLVCRDGDWFKLTWDNDSSGDILNKTKYILANRGILLSTKQILGSL